MRRALVFLFFALLVFVLDRPAKADDGHPARTFALVVTSNKSPRLARPDLRYADDDGAKYYAMFRTLAAEDDVALLSTFDADTRKLFPDIATRAKPPTRENVREATRRIAERVRAAGGASDFYFVFAGHGDVEHGKGFLELEDSAFTADDIDALLRAVPATRAHVVLDSCNAFFAIRARKPGGRHFVTSDEAQKSLAAALPPHVGVFLSTSAEANVYEWSSIQSGIFSHAVRSGLAGGADANGDGRITYDELRAFVDVASRDVKNPAYRPQVFARGPAGKGDTSLVELARAKGRRVGLDEARRRLSIRDVNDIPWFDLHKEEGAGATLVLPAEVAKGGAIEERDEDETWVRRALPDDETIAFASLPTATQLASARASDDVFRSFFARPFGPKAYVQALEEQTKEPEPVFGVSRDERERLRLMLYEASDASSRRKLLVDGSVGAIYAGVGVLGGILLAQGIRDEKSGPIVLGSGLLAAGAVVTTVSAVRLFRPTFEERAYDRFVRRIANEPDSRRAYAQAEAALLAAAEGDRSGRTWNRWVGLGGLAAYGTFTGVAINAVDGDLRRLNPVAIAVFSSLTLLGGVAFIDSFFPTPTERLAEIWKRDPLRAGGAAARRNNTPTLGIGPFGLSGTF